MVGRAFEANGERDWAAKYLDRSAWPVTDTPTPFGTDDGLAVLASAAGNDPGNPVALVGMIRGLIDAGQSGDALDRAKALAAANPGAPAAHLLVGDTLMMMGRFGEAADAYRRAADIKFDEATMLRVVDALDHAGRRPEASSVLALFLGQHPENVAALRIAAHWQIASRDWDGAIGTLEDLRSRVGSRDAGLLAELTYANIGAENFDDALGYGAAAYEIAPMSPAATDAYGWAFYAAGDARQGEGPARKGGVARTAPVRASAGTSRRPMPISAAMPRPRRRSRWRWAIPPSPIARRRKRCSRRWAECNAGRMTDPIDRIAAALERIAPPAPADADPLAHPAYVWRDGGLAAARAFDPLPLDLLLGIDAQKAALVEDFRRLAAGHAAQDVLLWGARGSGKSALGQERRRGDPGGRCGRSR